MTFFHCLRSLTVFTQSDVAMRLKRSLEAPLSDLCSEAVTHSTSLRKVCSSLMTSIQLRNPGYR